METKVKVLNIETLYVTYKTEILAYVLYRVKKLVVAEELTNDVFIKANKYLSNYDSNRSGIKTWLYNITNSSIIDYFRVAHLGLTVSYDCGIEGIEQNYLLNFLSVNRASYNKADSLTDTHDFDNKFNRIIDSMKPNYQKVADLYYRQDLTYNEIAKICEIPLGSVKGMINRCKVLLQSSFQVERAEYGIK